MCVQDINLDNNDHDIEWIEPHCVPHCFLLHVKIIKISGCDGENKQERMIIKPLDCKLNKKILKFERDARTCQVETFGSYH